MAAKKEDEIMAEYLLQGGKMLEKTCKTCGCPMFEYKGETFCVVCAEREIEEDEKTAPQTGTRPQPSLEQTLRGASAALLDTAALSDELAATIHELCARIRTEEDPDRCLTLMDAVKIGIEALAQLRQV